MVVVTQKMETPKVAVVILNYNGLHWLKQFLKTVVEKSSNADIYVADNASTDLSLSFVENHFPQVKVVKNKNNSGYAAGYNHALQEICADYYILLNSDVEVTDNWITPIIDVMENDTTIAACQPKIKHHTNKLSFEYAGASGGFLDKFGYPFCRGRIFEKIEIDNGQYDDSTEVFWASGACLFLRSTAFYEVGGFDWDFFAHMEEIDLCWKMKNKGYKIMCIPTSTVYHVGGGTLANGSRLKTYLNYRNNLLLLYKNLNPKNRNLILFIRLCLDGISSLKFILEGRPLHILEILKAHLYFHFKKGPFRKKRPSEFKVKLGSKSIVFAYFFEKKRRFSQLKSDFS